MTNEELLSEFARYLDDVLNDSAMLTRIKEKTAATPGVAPRCHGYVVRAVRFLHLKPEHTKQAVLAAVESYAESHTLQEMTHEYYCALERDFQSDALEIFFGFLEILQATR